MNLFQTTCCSVALCGAPLLQGQGFETDQLINVNYYGWLDQYSITDRGFVGDEACVPTSSTNAMTYLQNINPQIFGSSLTGTSYASWIATDELLIDLMNTTVKSGTTDFRFVPALNTYITQTKGFPNVQFSGLFYPFNDWNPPKYPKPSYIQAGLPTIEFISTAIGAGSALLVGITYNNGSGGHEILVNGMAWDSDSQSGTLYFIDPLDPSQNYSPAIPTGPVKQTTGTILLGSENVTGLGDLDQAVNNQLYLTYTQYDGSLPYNGSYDTAPSLIWTALAVGGAVYTPFNTLLTEGNNYAIATAFDTLDPTTASMFPVLAVLNTIDPVTPSIVMTGKTMAARATSFSGSSALSAAFSQFDPSPFNATLYAEAIAAEAVQTLVGDHLWQYRRPCSCPPTECLLSVWGAPFEQSVHQYGSSFSVPQSSYRDFVRGFVVGADLSLGDGWLVGGAYASTKSHLKWKYAPARAHFPAYEGLIYGAFVGDPLWVDASVGYSYNKVQATRTVTLVSPIPLIAPIVETLTHTAKSNLWTAHFGAAYDAYTECCCGTDVVLWPFVNVDAFYTEQPDYTEHGSPGFPLALHVYKKCSKLLRPEAGVGGSLYKAYCDIIAFADVALSYSYEYYFRGQNTTAHFVPSSSSQFTVSGLRPCNNLFCPTVQLGVTSPSNTCRLQINYHGAYGVKYVLNEVAAELAFTF